MGQATICNIGDLTQEQLDALGQSLARRRYVVKARAKDRKFSLTHVADNPTGNLIDAGDRNFHSSIVLGRDIAADLVKQMFGTRYGIFMCDGDSPSKDELLLAEQNMLRYDQFCIAEGDKEWARTHKHENIDDNWKVAAKRRGANREWASENIDKVPCPSCGALMLRDMAKCPTGCIVNVDKALAAGIISKQQWTDIKQARGESLPKVKTPAVEATA